MLYHGDRDWKASDIGRRPAQQFNPRHDRRGRFADAAGTGGEYQPSIADYRGPRAAERRVIEKAGVTMRFSDERATVSRGGATYSPYHRQISIGYDTSGEDVVHEIGHALDHAMAQPSGRPLAGATAYWSDRGLASALTADRRRGGFSERTAPYWMSTTREAFAHAYAAIRAPGGRYSSIVQDMPNTKRAVLRQLGRLR